MSARAGGAEGSRCDISGADKHRGKASPMSSWGDSSRDSPVKSVVGAPANSARRERSFNSTGARMDGQVSMLEHELMNAQCHRLIALYPNRNDLLSGNAWFRTIERCEQQMIHCKPCARAQHTHAHRNHAKERYRLVLSFHGRGHRRARRVTGMVNST